MPQKLGIFSFLILNTLGVPKVPISGLEALKYRSGNPGALTGTNYYQKAQQIHLFVFFCFVLFCCFFLGGGGVWTSNMHLLSCLGHEP